MLVVWGHKQLYWRIKDSMRKRKTHTAKRKRIYSHAMCSVLFLSSLFSRTICNLVNEAIIKGFDSQGHPAGGLPASTHDARRTHPFTLHCPLTLPLIWCDICWKTMQKGYFLRRVCANIAPIQWTALKNLASGWIGDCWYYIAKKNHF